MALVSGGQPDPPVVIGFGGFEREDYGWRAVMYVTNLSSRAFQTPKFARMEFLNLDATVGPLVRRHSGGSPISMSLWGLPNISTMSPRKRYAVYLKPSEELPWRAIVTLKKVSLSDRLPYAVQDRLPSWARSKNSYLNVTSEWVTPCPRLLP